MNEVNKEKVSKLSLAPITTLMCILSGTFLIMLVMLFSLYCKALNGVIEGKLPIEKLDIKMSDGFIGATATLIGIMVTFVIGYQILNAIQIKKDMDIYKDDIAIHKFEFESFLSRINNVKIIADIKEIESNLLITISSLDALMVKYNNGNTDLTLLYNDYLVQLYKYLDNLSSYIEHVKSIDTKYLYEGFSSEVIKNALSEGVLTEYEKKQGLPEHGNRDYVLLGAVTSIKRDVDSEVLKKYLSDIESIVGVIVINNMLKNNN